VTIGAMGLYPRGHRPLLYLSLVYIAYYFVMSVILTIKGLPERGDEPAGHPAGTA